MPHYQTVTRVTVAFGHSALEKKPLLKLLWTIDIFSFHKIFSLRAFVCDKSPHTGCIFLLDSSMPYSSIDIFKRGFFFSQLYLTWGPALWRHLKKKQVHFLVLLLWDSFPATLFANHKDHPSMLGRENILKIPNLYYLPLQQCYLFE